MYPEFVAQAKEEREDEAAIVFTHAMKAEEVHASLYLQALEAVREGKDLDVEKIFLCPVCGNVELGAAPEKCPIWRGPGAHVPRESSTPSFQSVASVLGPREVNCPCATRCALPTS